MWFITQFNNFLQATHVLLLTFGLTIHELSITGGFYFSHSELVNIILLSVEC